MIVENALLKPPRIGREKPWHQDSAIFDLLPETPVVGTWIALDDADEGNGCMWVIPGSHKRGPSPHFMLSDWQLCDGDVPKDEAVPVPLKSGDCMFWDGLTYHYSPPNRSDRRRRALQFHYCPKGTPRITKEARLAIYGGEQTGKTC